MAHHQLFEWEARRFDDDDRAITVGEAQALVRAAAVPAKRLGGNQRAFEFGREALTAQNLVGMVVASGTTCELLPKVDREGIGDAPSLRRRLIHMLALAYELPIADDAATMMETQSHTLLEILITRFVAMLREAIRRGVPRAYVAHSDDLPALRGRLDVMRQFTTLAASPQRLASRYDEFSDDITLNQVMRAAVIRLRHLARSIVNQQALAELTLVYADVSSVPGTRLRWEKIVPDRINARWQVLLRLARLILGDQFQNSAVGTADGFALLFDMNGLFERYVEKLLAPIASVQGGQLKAQGGARFCLHPEDGGDALFATYPDLQILKNGRVEMIIDTKWKRLADPAADRKMNVAQSDLYQMMAYAGLYECKRLVLLYPHHAGLTSTMPVHHRFARHGGEVRLTIAAIDMSSHDAARAGLKVLVGEGLSRSHVASA